MSYLVLARKYRPRNFESLVGQPHVVQALTNALTQQRLHHAYLFTGTRGVGKTTIARILAKSLDCTGPDGHGGITARPCGVCEACRDIDAGRYIDYVELDAASNRGVEEITRLLDQAVYKPVLARFKVYLIDEVHMLSNTAFNAMLKTLEEPPEYLKFILATTDPQKVPPTVLSRCLQFNLRPMAGETIHEHLADVLAQEHIAAEPAALRLLARAARGSMRDALSLADQAVAFGAGAIDEAGVRSMLGAVDRGHAVRLVEALAARDGAGVVAAVDALRALGLSAAALLEEMATLLQQMALARAVPDALDPYDPVSASVAQLAPLLAADETQLLYSIVLHGRAEIALAPDEYSGLVMVLLRMLAFPAQGRPAGSEAGDADDARSMSAARGSGSRPVSLALRAASPPTATARPMSGSGLPVGKPGAAAAPAVVVVPVRVPLAIAVPVLVQGEPVRPSGPDEGFLQAGSTPSTKVDAMNAPGVAAASTEAPAVTKEPSAGDAAIAAPVGRHEIALVDVAEGPEVAEVADVADVAEFVDVAGVSDGADVGDRWDRVVRQMLASGSIGALVRELAMQAQCMAVHDDVSPVVWRLRVERDMLRSAAQSDRLQAALAEALGHTVRLELEAGVAVDSPALRDGVERDRRQAEAERTIHEDPLVKALMAQYKTARVVPGSIKPV